MAEFGFSEHEARHFLSRELGKAAASTSFYWESEEVEELLDLVVDAVARLIAENNKKFRQDWERDSRHRAAGF